MTVSIVILTLNEEVNLSDCLDSVKWCDDMVVFDSYSTDRTVEIAKTAGAKVVQRRFDNYAAQRNASLNEVSYKHDWILMLDADERVSPELQIEIENKFCGVDDETSLLRVRRKDMFMGRWLRRSSGYPTWFGRLIRKGRVRVLREINEEYHTDGHVGYLQEHLIHYPFNKGIDHWFERHNRYSSMEAALLAGESRHRFNARELLSNDPAIRRRSMKQLAYKLPGRPLAVFFYLYFFRLGFLDGRPGLTYSYLRFIYEKMIDLKLQENSQRQKGLPF
ncbi:MAG: glycosyltransferase family 2 protein [Thermodesulfobacteriota bacterium]